jgi:excisionase family DNA binding protein
MAMDANARTLSIRAAALRYGVSRDLLRGAIQAGELAGYRPGARTVRVFVEEVEAWLRSHRLTPAARAEAVVEARLAREAAR